MGPKADFAKKLVEGVMNWGVRPVIAGTKKVVTPTTVDLAGRMTLGSGLGYAGDRIARGSIGNDESPGFVPDSQTTATILAGAGLGAASRYTSGAGKSLANNASKGVVGSTKRVLGKGIHALSEVPSPQATIGGRHVGALTGTASAIAIPSLVYRDRDRVTQSNSWHANNKVSDDAQAQAKAEAAQAAQAAAGPAGAPGVTSGAGTRPEGRQGPLSALGSAAGVGATNLSRQAPLSALGAVGGVGAANMAGKPNTYDPSLWERTTGAISGMPNWAKGLGIGAAGLGGGYLLDRLTSKKRTDEDDEDDSGPGLGTLAGGLGAGLGISALSGHSMSNLASKNWWNKSSAHKFPALIHCKYALESPPLQSPLPELLSTPPELETPPPAVPAVPAGLGTTPPEPAVTPKPLQTSGDGRGANNPLLGSVSPSVPKGKGIVSPQYKYDDQLQSGATDAAFGKPETGPGVAKGLLSNLPNQTINPALKPNTTATADGKLSSPQAAGGDAKGMNSVYPPETAPGLTPNAAGTAAGKSLGASDGESPAALKSFGEKVINKHFAGSFTAANDSARMNLYKQAPPEVKAKGPEGIRGWVEHILGNMEPWQVGLLGVGVGLAAAGFMGMAGGQGGMAGPLLGLGGLAGAGYLAYNAAQKPPKGVADTSGGIAPGTRSPGIGGAAGLGSFGAVPNESAAPVAAGAPGAPGDPTAPGAGQPGGPGEGDTQVEMARLSQDPRFSKYFAEGKPDTNAIGWAALNNKGELEQLAAQLSPATKAEVARQAVANPNDSFLTMAAKSNILQILGKTGGQ